jgi:hypothetical protein
MMRNSKRLALAGSVALALGWMGTASAAATILDISASGPGLGSFLANDIDNDDRSLVLTKTFEQVGPITLTFTVGHATGGGGPFDVTEPIFNNTGTEFIDFHFAIVEPAEVQGNGVVFTSFNQSILSGFTLDSPPSSGPRNLNFTGSLVSAEATAALFNLSPFDPGNGNTYTFQLVQTPSVVPEPATWILIVAGVLGVVAGMRRRRL